MIVPADAFAFPSHARRPRVAEVEAEPGLVVETADGRFCGAVIRTGLALDAGERRSTVTLEDRNGRQRIFALLPAAFALDGAVITLIAPRPSTVVKPVVKRRTASGSFAVADQPARVARASRIWVEGIHDAALVERIWGDDLRVEGVVVEPLDGIDELADRVREFGPAAGAARRGARRSPRAGQQGIAHRRRCPQRVRARSPGTPTSTSGKP